MALRSAGSFRKKIRTFYQLTQHSRNSRHGLDVALPQRTDEHGRLLSITVRGTRRPLFRTRDCKQDFTHPHTEASNERICEGKPDRAQRSMNERLRAKRKAERPQQQVRQARAEREAKVRNLQQ